VIKTSRGFHCALQMRRTGAEARLCNTEVCGGLSYQNVTKVLSSCPLFALRTQYPTRIHTCLPFRCMTFFAQQSSPNFFTVHQRGLDSVLQQTSRLDAFLKRCKRYFYCADNSPTVYQLFSDADDQLFSRTSHIQTHVLKPLLPTTTQQYTLITIL